MRESTLLVDLVIGGEKITATPDHPFWVVGKGWTEAGELGCGDAVVTRSGARVQVEGLTRRQGSFQVYNFEVANSHSYFVGTLGLLVHNNGGCETAVGNLDPLHSPQTSGARPELSKLSDDELLHSVNNPTNGDYLKINTETGKLVDGNGRAYELMKRAADPNSKITPQTKVKYNPYTSDRSMFPF